MIVFILVLFVSLYWCCYGWKMDGQWATILFLLFSNVFSYFLFFAKMENDFFHDMIHESWWDLIRHNQQFSVWFWFSERCLKKLTISTINTFLFTLYKIGAKWIPCRKLLNALRQILSWSFVFHRSRLPLSHFHEPGFLIIPIYEEGC